MISGILKENPRTPVEQITTSSEADAGVLKHALSELHTFAHTNLRELSKMEKGRGGHHHQLICSAALMWESWRKRMGCCTTW